MRSRTIRGVFATAMMMGMTWAAVEPLKASALQKTDADCDANSLTESDVKLCKQVNRVIVNGGELAAVAAAGATAFMLAGGALFGQRRRKEPKAEPQKKVMPQNRRIV